MTSIWDEPIFEVGQYLKCVNSGGYYALSEGKVYECVEYEGVGRINSFDFPAYVCVLDNNGERSWSHARRFKLMEVI